VRQVDLAFEWNDLTLAGTLHLPSEGRNPLLLMMQGSGPSDRDSDGYFLPIRDVFLERGIATYSFDKPGCGESIGDWRDYALEGRADQANAALNALREYPGVDVAKIGVFGHSQGGWLTQILASRLPALSFAIASSGPSIPITDQDLYGCEHTMRAQGHSEKGIADALAFLRKVHQAAQSGLDYAVADTELLQAARKESWYGYMTIDGPEDWRLIGRFVKERYQPREALRQVRCPYLAVYGGLDLLVPAWRCAEETGQALNHAANPDVTVVVFPKGDHRLRDAASGDFVPGYLDLLGNWTAARVSSASISRT
jgi:uncharacterized protein